MNQFSAFLRVLAHFGNKHNLIITPVGKHRFVLSGKKFFNCTCASQAHTHQHTVD